MTTPERRSIRRRRSVGWSAFKEYANGALWVLPSFAALIALIAGAGMASMKVRPGGFLDRIAFQGTADDARTLLISVSSTVVTVIALVLGLTVVALQLSSTQFSPRLLRNFLRDRATQTVLSVFIATFVYSAAGLFTVGLDAGTRTENYPRLAVSGSMVLLFASLGMVVYFADHLVHSIQIDSINRMVERNTLRIIDDLDIDSVVSEVPKVPEWAVPLYARKSGYIQGVYPELLLPVAHAAHVTICIRPRVGTHVIEGTTIGWVWRESAADPRPAPGRFADAVHADLRIGFERTLEQDVNFGVRQQLDIACKALSPAINDPYTAVQAIEHLSVVCCKLAILPLGTSILSDDEGTGRVIVPASAFAEYVFFICGIISRYGAGEITVMTSLVRLLRSCSEVLPRGSRRLSALDQAAAELLEDAERRMQRPRDLEAMRAAVESLRQRISLQQNQPS